MRIKYGVSENRYVGQVNVLTTIFTATTAAATTTTTTASTTTTTKSSNVALSLI